MRRSIFRGRVFGAAILAGTLMGTVGVGNAQEECASAPHPGGDWPVYGHDFHNTRSQPAEERIGPENAGKLEAMWSFTPDDFGGMGRMESTPVVAEGCVYFSTSSGYVYALNAETGELVWGKRIAGTTRGQCCGGTIMAGTVHEGVVYWGVARAQRKLDSISEKVGPHITALDSQTGEVLWRSPELALEPGAYTNSSVVYYDGMVWLGLSGPEIITPDSGDASNRHGGFAIVDAADGSVIVRRKTVPKEEFEIRGDGGGSIWSTLAIDDEGFGYATTGQPNPWEGSIQSDYTNAMVKIDMKRQRNGKENPDFAKIVGRFWGDSDLGRDVDWAGSPTLYENADGRQMVAAAQKSGNLHGGFTSADVDGTMFVGTNMSKEWTFPLSAVGSPLFNFCSVANDGTNVYGAGAPPGQLWSVNGTTGAPNWVQPVETRYAATPVAYANGVVYYPGDGIFYAFDAATGEPLLERNVDLDVGADCSNVGGGLSIARNTVYVMCGTRTDTDEGQFGPSDEPSGWLVAYRLPG